jgi:transposase-like protein
MQVLGDEVQLLPSLLESRRRHERALLSMVQEAYIHGLSTRDVNALAGAQLKGISKDQVSRICKALDAQVHAFRNDRAKRFFGLATSKRVTRPFKGIS